MRKHQMGLAAFDLDGTLLRGETVCEAIARQMGHLERMRELEGLRDQAEILAGRAELARYYRTVTVAELQSYLAVLRLAPGVEAGFRLLRHQGLKIALVSITWEFAVAWFARTLGADYYLGTGLSPDGHITHVWPADKARWVTALAGTLGLPLEAVAAVGDSWGDADMLRVVGRPFFVGVTRPAELEQVPHYPHSDMYAIAQRIVETSPDD